MVIRVEPKQVSALLPRIGIACLVSISVVTSGTFFAVMVNRAIHDPHPRSNTSSANPLPVESLPISTVTALGHLTPEGEVVHLSAPTANQRLTALQVKEGDEVQAGQIIAVMDNAAQYQAVVASASARVRVAQARLAQVQAGEELSAIEAQRRKVTELEAQLTGDRQVQQAALMRQQATLNHAEANYQRYQTLFAAGAVSQVEVETRRLEAETERERLHEAEARLNEIQHTGEERIRAARATLTSLTHVQPADVLVAQAEVDEALSQLRKAEVDLASVSVRSPVAGQILQVNTRVGEIVGSNGIVDIGQTQQMYAIAEVYESDIQFVKAGQSVTIVSDYGGFAGSITGTVESIGLQIGHPGIASDDPTLDTDVRVVRVKIRLNLTDSERVKTLNQLQVRASIQVH